MLVEKHKLLEQNDRQELIVMWQDLVNLMAELCDTPAGFIVQVTPENYQVTIANQNLKNPYKAGVVIEHDVNIFCRQVVQEQSPLYVGNATELNVWQDNPEVSADGFNTYLGYPLYWPSGNIFGTICVMDFAKTDFDERYHRLLQHFKKMAEYELKLINQKLTIEFISYTDEQTHLLNRRGLLAQYSSRLKLADRHNELVAVNFYDINQLKKVNDKFGHTSGDKLIENFAEALNLTYRETDLLARFGGDEFIGLVFIKKASEIERLNLRLKDNLAKYASAVDITFSVGTIIVEAKEIKSDLDLQEIIGQADKAMYREKQLQKSNSPI